MEDGRKYFLILRVDRPTFNDRVAIQVRRDFVKQKNFVSDVIGKPLVQIGFDYVVEGLIYVTEKNLPKEFLITKKLSKSFNS